MGKNIMNMRTKVKLIVEHYKDCTNQHLAILLMAGSNVITTVTELSHTYIHTCLTDKQAWEWVVALYLSWLSFDPPYMFLRL